MKKIAKSLSLLFLILFLFAAVDAEEHRDRSLQQLKEAGFTVSPSLPVAGVSQRKLRPRTEIEARLSALRTLVLWVATPSGFDLSSLKESALSGPDSKWLTEEEKSIFQLKQPVARERYLDSIGWQIENVWALAWVLGFGEVPTLEGQIQGDLVSDLLFGYTSPLTEKKASQPRRSDSNGRPLLLRSQRRPLCSTRRGYCTIGI